MHNTVPVLQVQLLWKIGPPVARCTGLLTSIIRGAELTPAPVCMNGPFERSLSRKSMARLTAQPKHAPRHDPIASVRSTLSFAQCSIFNDRCKVIAHVLRDKRGIQVRRHAHPPERTRCVRHSKQVERYRWIYAPTVPNPRAQAHRARWGGKPG